MLYKTLKLLQISTQLLFPVRDAINEKIPAPGGAIKSVQEAFDVIDAQHKLKGLLAAEIKQEKLSAALNNANPKEQIENLKRALFKRLCESVATLLPLPCDGFGVMTEKEIFAHLFYVESVRQRDGASCGWRVLLAALKDNADRKNGKISDAQRDVSGLTPDCFPEEWRKKNEEELKKIQGSGILQMEESVKLCVRFLEDLYKDDCYKDSVIPQPKAYLPICRMSDEKTEDWNNSKAEQHHLYDLAKKFCVEDFYVIGSQGNNTPGLVFDSNEELWKQAYKQLLECNDLANFETWNDNYCIYFNQRQEQLANLILKNEKKREDVITDNLLEDDIRRIIDPKNEIKDESQTKKIAELKASIDWLSGDCKNKNLQAQEKKEKENELKKLRKEYDDAQKKFADYCRGQLKIRVDGSSDLRKEVLKTIEKRIKTQFSRSVEALYEIARINNGYREYFDNHETSLKLIATVDEKVRSICEKYQEIGSIKRIADDAEKVKKIIALKKAIFASEKPALNTADSQVYDQFLKDLDTACMADKDLEKQLIQSYRAYEDATKQGLSNQEKLAEIFFVQRKKILDCELEIVRKHKFWQWIGAKVELAWVEKFLIEQIREKFKKRYLGNPNETGAIYFALNLPDHWILASVIKGKEGKPFIRIEDTLNSDASNSSMWIQGREYIEFIYTHFVKPFLVSEDNRSSNATCS